MGAPLRLRTISLSEAERQACEIRLRAERKAGQLLKQQVSRGGSKSREATLKPLGISKDQSSQWQQRRHPRGAV
jgi:hypothetical protein